jgi:hypothetical protein
MDISDLKSLANAAFDHALYRKQLRERIQADLVFTENGGMFKITPELLAFVQTWPVDELYLEDIHGNPIQLSKQTFLIRAQQHYQTAMNAWHIEFEKSKKIRRGRDV